MLSLRKAVTVAGLCALFTYTLADDIACSASHPCEIGCCGKNGLCGTGPNYCAAGNCTASCDAKSDCDPGWGMKWSKSSSCPLNVCCSEYGFCGTTSDFCGKKKVKQPSCSGTSSRGRTIGYYEGWSSTRACDGMAPENIPVGAYTHLNYAFAFIDPKSFAVAPMSDIDLDLYSRMTGLKDINPGLQTWISIGGWSMNDDDQPTHSTFSDLAGSESAQQAFFKSLLQFMSTYGFDGVDIDWEYPVAPERSGKEADYKNYPVFLKNLREALGSTGHKYGLSITLPSSYWYMKNFDIVRIEPIVDWFNIMTYDLHGTWDSTDKAIGSVINAHTNLTEIDLSLDLMWRNDIDPNKVVLGLGFYGRSFTLADPSCKSAGCAFKSGGKPGNCSASAGTLMASEIQAIVAAGGHTPTLDKEAAVQILVFDTDQWVSYDDKTTLKMKTDYANSKCLGGTMVWAVSTDSKGDAAQALGDNQKMFLSGKSLFGGSNTDTGKDSLSECYWGDCSDNPTCSHGGVAVQMGKGKGASNVAIFNGCADGQKRNFCCPSDDAPTCEWKGTAPFCAKPRCSDDKVQVTTDSHGSGAPCIFSHKSLCCSLTASVASLGQCKWVGSAPNCAKGSNKADCPKDFPVQDTYSHSGAGGEQYCFHGYKSFCCTDPDPYKDRNCAWTTIDHWILHPFTCATGCPNGQVIVAEDSMNHDNSRWCLGNTASYYCCDKLPGPDDTSSAKANFCADTFGSYPLNPEHDEDGNVADFVEVYMYEDHCFDIPNNADPDGDYTKRWLGTDSGSGHVPVGNGTRVIAELVATGLDRLSDSQQALLVDAMPAGERNNGHPKVCRADGQCFYVSGAHHVDDAELSELRALFADAASTDDAASGTLQDRGTRGIKICMPNKKTATFRAKNYPSVSKLQALKTTVYTVTQIAKCAGMLLAKGAKQVGEQYVTEHVLELQTPGQWANSMIEGLLSSGATAPGNKYDWTKMFEDGKGYIFVSWKDLGVAPPANFPGKTPHDSMMAGLGSSDITDNLLILDRRTNSLKAAAWGLFKNVIGKDRWADATDEEKVGHINRVEQVCAYLSDPEAQTALQSGFNAVFQVLKQLDAAAAVNSNIATVAGFTFAETFKIFAKDHFSTIQNNLQAFVTDRGKEMLVYWASNAAQQRHQGFADQVHKSLSDLVVNVATRLVFDYSWVNSA